MGAFRAHVHKERFMQQAIVLFIPRVGSVQKADMRLRTVRSPHCPNDVRDTDGEEDDKRGTCGSCAWGFYNMESPLPQAGEDPAMLALTPISEGEAPAGYRSQCGTVTLYRDTSGRVGALRDIDGAQRFFAGIKDNWAYERYLRAHPELMQN